MDHPVRSCGNERELAIVMLGCKGCVVGLPILVWKGKRRRETKNGKCGALLMVVRGVNFGRHRACVCPSEEAFLHGTAHFSKLRGLC